MQIWKFGRESDVKAWVLLNKSYYLGCGWIQTEGIQNVTLMLTLRYNYKCKIEGKEKEKICGMGA